MQITEVLSSLSNVRKANKGFTARCPAHDDSHNSLGVTESNGTILMRCHAGCDFASITRSIGIDQKDCFPPASSWSAIQPAREIAAYPFRDENRTVLYENVRFEPKTFRQRHFENGKPVWGLNGTRRVPYRLPEINEARGAGCTDIVATEGEKDADSVASLGLAATSFKSWKPEMGEFVRGLNVVVLCDHDGSGVTQAEDFAKMIRPYAASVKIVDLYESDPLPQKGGKDVTDWIDALRSDGLDNTEIAERLAIITDAADTYEHPLKASSAKASVPIPIPDLLPVEALSPEIIPEPLRTWLTDISERRGCPLEYPTVAAIVALGSVIGTKVGVRPKRHDDWFLFPNLWSLAIGASGTQKTDATNDGLRPLEEIEKAEAEAYQTNLPQIKADALDRRIEAEAIEAQLKAIYSGKAKNTDSIVDKEALKARYADLQSVTDETPRRAMVNDTTIEKLGMLLNANPNGLVSVQDEIAPFLDSLENKDRQNDLKFYLKSANGTGTELVDRVSRESLVIKNLCLSMVGGTQPSRIGALAERTVEKDGDNGMLARFTLAVFPDMRPEYRYVDSEPKDISRVRAIYKGLYDLKPVTAPFKLLATEAGGGAFLNFDPEAQAFFAEWLTSIEGEIRANGTNGTGIPDSHLQKLKGTMPKLALIFQMLDLQCGLDHHITGISLKNAELAAKWIEFLKSHARRVYASSTRPEFKGARLILAKHHTGDLPDVITARLVYRKHWRGLSTPKEVGDAIEVLTDHNWLEPITRPTDGKPVTEYIFHSSSVEQRSAISAKSI